MPEDSTLSRVASTVSNGAKSIIKPDYSKCPVGLKWRSNTFFIIVTIGVGIFTDLFLYGLIVPVIPFMLEDRVGIPRSHVQSNVSMLLAIYAGASVVFSPIAGILADKTSSRQLPFLLGLSALLFATLLFAVGQSIPVLAIARILQGLSGSVVWTIGLAMCLETVGPERLGRVIGTIFSVISVGTQASPTIGGILYEKAGLPGVFGLAIALLVVDFVMRLLVIEKKIAAKYEAHMRRASLANPQTDGMDGTAEHDNHDPDEESPLLSGNEHKKYHLNEPKSWILRKVPILACIHDTALLAALWLAFVQAILLGSFDATIPTVAEDYYDFDALKAGALFLSLGLTDLITGPIGGWAVDKYGTKPAAVIGSSDQVKIWAGLLALIGIGMGIFGAPSIVEAGAVVQRYYKANPDFFGENGPYAQLYGLNSMCFCGGLTIGPVIAGGLKDSIGYGNMNAVLAAIAGVTSIISWLYIGGPPRIGKWKVLK
ncbi:MFS general substrate transporter [Rhizodiscina lignyota]|uniref:MFS general substrate transporter n=1 Tax=Rhizodiscina lignyota TaxID=1504668 RepID=A0A9P4MA19_9PEZI|nr:MFS general substrate transporter [Rhizodiscina lignyota]